MVYTQKAAPHFSNPLLGIWKLNEALFIVFDVEEHTPHTDTCKSRDCMGQH